MPTDFQNATVAFFQGRDTEATSRLIREHGGEPLLGPAVCEVPVADDGPRRQFQKDLLAGRVDVLVLLSGMGCRMLLESLGEQGRGALKPVRLVARGPKTVEALKAFGLTPDVSVAPPYTTGRLLEALQDESLAGRRVVIQETGRPSATILEKLAEQNAEATSVPVYRWDLPEDTQPLSDAVDRLIAGEVPFAMFTNAAQVSGLFVVAGERAEPLREALRTVCIAAVGPSVKEALKRHCLQSDWEPDKTELRELVQEFSRRGHDLLFKKRTAVANGIDTHQWRRVDMVWEKPAEGEGPLPTIDDSVFLKACRREPVPHTPIWIMRQAGRYQRAYREVRAGLSMIELCQSPEVAAEVTLMAVDRLGVDAAIIFSDILTPLIPMGLDLEFAKGEGPVIHNPVRTMADVERLKTPDLKELEYVFEALRLTRKALRPDIGLIGFAGAPFTVASYVIEGGKSKNYQRAKTMMHADRATWDALIGRLVDLLIDYLKGQIDAGANAVQLFDSWVGALGPDDYRQAVLPHVHRLIASVSGRVPVIHFATGNPALLPLMKEAGGDVIGLDWRVDLNQAWDALGHDVAVMGNLDPISLYAPDEVIRQRAEAVLKQAGGRPGHIFNLGHGVLPDHDPTKVAALVDAVHEMSKRPVASVVS